jgi:hypothetical protein
MAARPSILDIRRNRLRELIRKWGGPGTLAKKLGYTSGSYLAQIAGPNPTRDISEDVARDIEGKLGLSNGWLDKEADTPAGDVNAPLVAEVLRIVMAVTAESKHDIGADKIAEVVALAYERAAASGSVDERYVRRLVNLIAL